METFRGTIFKGVRTLRINQNQNQLCFCADVKTLKHPWATIGDGEVATPAVESI